MKTFATKLENRKQKKKRNQESKTKKSENNFSVGWGIRDRMEKLEYVSCSLFPIIQ